MVHIVDFKAGFCEREIHRHNGDPLNWGYILKRRKKNPANYFFKIIYDMEKDDID